MFRPHLEAFLVALLLTSGAFGDGACCLPDMSCLPVADDAACSPLGGVFLDGADCADAPCAVGACCSDDSCVQADPVSCVLGGRDFAGAGLDCLDDPCGHGTGACCVGTSCQEIPLADCVTASGDWLGTGVMCIQAPCDLGACCVGEACSDVRRFECDALGGELQTGTDCEFDPCIAASDCPEDTLFGQNRDTPADFTAFTSEEDPGFSRLEDFSGVAGAIDAVTWWGLDLRNIGGNQFVECAESDPTFEIVFLTDAGGRPGVPVCSYTITASRTPLGIFYLGAELNEYAVTLPQPCVLVNGWVSITGQGDPDCWFLWMSAGLGFSWCDGCFAPAESSDLALCLQGRFGGVAGACCDETSASCVDGVDIAECTAAGQRFVPDTLCADLEPACGVILGACCQDDATCTVETERDCGLTTGNWLGASTLCAHCPCIAPCPDEAINEGEPICFDGYVDATNAGCDGSVVAFSSIAFGDTVCGTGGVHLLEGENVADFDWYEFTLPAPQQVTVSARAEYRGGLFLVDGTGGCATAEVIDSIGGLECADLTLTATIGPGTYWAVIAPIAFSDSSGCGAAYTLTLDGPACAADLDGDGVVGFNDVVALLSDWGPCPGCAADLDGDGIVGFSDLVSMLADWGTC